MNVKSRNGPQMKFLICGTFLLSYAFFNPLQYAPVLVR